MSANTKIEWADHTFNPWIGCTKVGPGCDNCYAKADFDDRKHRVTWGAGQARSRTKTWGDPVRWNKQPYYECTCCGWRGNTADPEFSHPSKGCIHDLVPTRARVFCASLADVFDNEVDPIWRIELMGLIERTPDLDWLLLTKRVGNAAEMLGDAATGAGLVRLPENVWIGATIVNQAEADRDIPKLLAVPAAKRFLSMEPLLGPVNLRHLNEDKETDEFDCLKPYTWEQEIELWRDTEDGWEESFEDYYGVTLAGLSGPMHAGIDWVIVGGESGPNARPMHPDWARSLRDQCQAAGVPFLFKQWGNWRPAAWFDGTDADNDSGDDFVDVDRTAHQFVAADGRTWDTCGGQYMYPPMPLGHWCLMVDEGKKAAGRLLDGREWNGVPA